jgi:hypothetical protein
MAVSCVFGLGWALRRAIYGTRLMATINGTLREGSVQPAEADY